MQIKCQGDFFTERVVRSWHRLSREATDVLPLEVLQASLGEALGSWNWRPSPQQGWELDGL